MANAVAADNKSTHKPKKNLPTTSLSAIDIANIKQEIDGKRQLPQTPSSSLRPDQQFVFNSEIVQTAAASSASAGINKDSKLRSHINIESPCILKQEMLDDDDADSVNVRSPDILCKKVRQAQQTKGSQIHNMCIQNEIELMRPPNYNNNRLMTITPTLLNEINSLKRVGTVNNNNCLSSRINKCKYIPTQVGKYAAAQGHMDVSVGGEKDDVTTDIIIPRERVISICNLDKDALDDYLNGGDSSQDQEAELLKYFQQDEESASGGAVDCTTTKTPNSNSVLPILENYQLNSDYQSKNIVNRTKLQSQMMEKVNQLSELRQYLQQNLQSNANSISAVKPEMPVHGYAGAALSMISNRYVNLREPFALSAPFQQQHLLHHHQQQQQQQPQQHQHQQLQLPHQQLQQNLKVLKRHSSNPTTPCNNNSSNNSSSNIPHSPNSRRKNFSFVPISPGPQSPRTVQGYQQAPSQHCNAQNPFISPRATSAIRKPILKTQQSAGAATLHQAAVTCTATNTAPTTHPRTPSNETNSAFISNIYSRSTQGNIVSASAPPSPSIPTSQQNVRYGKKINSSFDTASSFIAAPSIATKKQFSSHPFVAGYPETRSQSVPLHCQMPVVSNTNKHILKDMYSSASSSVAPTPIPHEYADFSDDNFIDILAANAAAGVSSSSVKLEDSLPSILEDNLGAVGGDSVLHISEIIPELQLRQNLPNISRSVPSTPQPTFCVGKNNGTCGIGNNKIASTQFDISKSVPTTPIAMSGTPFRYSPEQNRDFLINGNTVETGKLGSFYNSRSQQVSVEKIPEIVEDIENDLVTFGDDADPIIGSDLLGNL